MNSKNYPLFAWLRNVSLAKKLYFVLGIMATLIGVELFALNFTIHTLSATRALVGAEGLWSKAEKDATGSLLKYSYTHDELEYQRYINMLSVILGDHKSRLALMKQPTDLQGAREGFLIGRIHPDDVDGVINVLTRFHSNRYIKSAIFYWTQGDSSIAVLQGLSSKMHRQILSGTASNEEINQTASEIQELNKKITLLEDNFSFTLGEGSRWMEHLILKILLAIAITVEFTGLFLTISVSRAITRGINEIVNVARKVANGDFLTRAKIYSKDEIGTLADSFNQMVGNLQRITSEEKRAEQALLSQKELYETLLKTQSEMGEGVIITENGEIVYVNQATCNMYGYTMEEIFEMPAFIKRVPKGETPAVPGEPYYNEAGLEVQHSGQSKIMQKNGTLLDIEFTTRNLRTEGRIQSITIFRDITERIRVDALLQNERENTVRAELAKKVGEKFLATMSHEIRTPMNAIIGFTDVVLNTPLNAEQKQYLGAIKTSGENLLVIINDVLDFSRIRAGKMPIERKEFKLTEIVSICVEMMLPRAIEKGTKISTDVEKGIPAYLIGDPTRLNQVLVNLLSNAVKFTDQGEIVVGVKKITEDFDEIELEFSVKDTGIGIAQDKLSSIFNVFTQASDDTARVYGGTGLGLAIVKQLAELQGGTVSVQSKPGKGSTFSLRIRYQKAEMPVMKTFGENGREEIEHPVSGLKVLVVEDNAMNQMLAKKVLSDWGWEVSFANNGVEAIEMVEKIDYDLILMDIQLPVMDGYEATLYIRNKMPLPKNYVPIIAMTAHVLQMEEEKCFAVGMDAYISKPFDRKQLYAKIVTVLNERAAEARYL